MPMLEVAQCMVPIMNMMPAESSRPGEEVARVGSVRHVPHQEFGETVGDGDAGEGQTQIPAGEALLDEVGHRQTEVFPYQVVTRIPEEDPEEHLPTHAFVEGIHLVGRQPVDMGCRPEETKHVLLPFIVVLGG